MFVIARRMNAPDEIYKNCSALSYYRLLSRLFPVSSEARVAVCSSTFYLMKFFIRSFGVWRTVGETAFRYLEDVAPLEKLIAICCTKVGGWWLSKRVRETESKKQNILRMRSTNRPQLWLFMTVLVRVRMYCTYCAWENVTRISHVTLLSSVRSRTNVVRPPYFVLGLCTVRGSN